MEKKFCSWSRKNEQFYNISGADVCNARKLQFNGGFNCTGDSSGFSCSISCPAGIEFNFPPSPVYKCLYETGVFLPQPIPQCKFGKSTFWSFPLFTVLTIIAESWLLFCLMVLIIPFVHNIFIIQTLAQDNDWIKVLSSYQWWQAATWRSRLQTNNMPAIHCNPILRRDDSLYS